MTRTNDGRTRSLDSLAPRYTVLFKGYLIGAVVAIALYLILPGTPLAARGGVILAAVLCSLFMFWGGYLVLGLQIALNGHTRFVREAGFFGFWFFALGTCLMLLPAVRREQLWPVGLLVPAATALGILRAWVRIKPKSRAAFQDVRSSGSAS